LNFGTNAFRAAAGDPEPSFETNQTYAIPNGKPLTLFLELL
jgi:hypothetical protein